MIVLVVILGVAFNVAVALGAVYIALRAVGDAEERHARVLSEALRSLVEPILSPGEVRQAENPSEEILVQEGPADMDPDLFLLDDDERALWTPPVDALGPDTLPNPG